MLVVKVVNAVVNPKIGGDQNGESGKGQKHNVSCKQKRQIQGDGSYCDLDASQQIETEKTR